MAANGGRQTQSGGISPLGLGLGLGTKKRCWFYGVPDTYIGSYLATEPNIACIIL